MVEARPSRGKWLFVLVFVQRQDLLEGRGVFLPSFPDLGTARILRCLRNAGIETKVVEGTARWLGPLLSDADRLLHGAMKGLVAPRWAKMILRAAEQGLGVLDEAVENARAVLRMESGERFFDSTAVRNALDWLAAAHSLFEGQLRLTGVVGHPLVRSLISEILEARPDLVAFSLRGDEGAVMQAVVQAVGRAGVPTVGGGWAGLGGDEQGLEGFRRRLGLTWFFSGPGEAVLPALYEKVRNGGGWPASGVDPVELNQDGFVDWDGRGTGQEAEDFGPLLGRRYFAPAPTLPLSSNRGCY